jgi:hypothetical protein
MHLAVSQRRPSEASSGTVIGTIGCVEWDYELLLHAINAFRVDRVLVVEEGTGLEARLISDLRWRPRLSSILEL